MQTILTNYGHRFITREMKLRTAEALQANPVTALLLLTLSEKIISGTPSALHQNLIERGFLEINNTLGTEGAEFRYKTNPLENVEQIVFEYTTRCNFNCRHCRNAFTEKTTEMNTGRLQTVADAFKAIHISKFQFIGGEVSKYGNGWLQLARHINAKRDCTVMLFTNGWWLENTDFDAAGKYYRNDSEYLADLKECGVTHILFSIDGHEAVHDHSRNQKGLYQRIVSSFERIKQYGLKPRISALFDNQPDPQTLRALSEISAAMYDLSPDSSLQTRIAKLMQDNTNQFSSFVDIGNAALQKTNKNRIKDIPMSLLHCKAF